MKTSTAAALLLGTGIAAFMTANRAGADTVLLFETSSGSSFGVAPQDYGDRVSANIQNGYRYGGAANTPHIVADYVNADGWPTSYGDLTNVIYPFGSSSILSVKLTADAGYQVALQSLDLAGWPSTDYTINSLQVRDGNGTLLFSQPGLLVQGDTSGPRHTTLNFPSLVAPVLLVSVDATNITTSFGAENIGLDNLRFSQVPEPATIVGLASAAVSGLALVLIRGNRLRAPVSNQTFRMVVGKPGLSQN